MDLRDLSVVMISYHEPNMRENWSVLKAQRPDSRLIEGITGIDHAYRAAGAISQTPFTITVDADTEVYSSFWNQSIPPVNQAVLSNPCKNSVNGLVYGHGSIKIWPTSVLQSVSSHLTHLDFFETIQYYATGIESGIHKIDGDRLQCGRSAYREVRKLLAVCAANFPSWDISSGIKKRLSAWLRVGIHMSLGPFALLGARLALNDASHLQSPLEPANLRDFGRLDKYLSESLLQPREQVLQMARKYDELVACFLQDDGSILNTRESRNAFDSPSVGPFKGLMRTST